VGVVTIGMIKHDTSLKRLVPYHVGSTVSITTIATKLCRLECIDMDMGLDSEWCCLFFWIYKVEGVEVDDEKYG